MAPDEESAVDDTSRSAKITTIPDDDTMYQVHLAPSTQYEVQVRALNGEGDSTFADATNWSHIGPRHDRREQQEADLRGHAGAYSSPWRWTRTRGRGRTSAARSRPRTRTATG